MVKEYWVDDHVAHRLKEEGDIVCPHCGEPQLELFIPGDSFVGVPCWSCDGKIDMTATTVKRTESIYRIHEGEDTRLFAEWSKGMIDSKTYGDHLERKNATENFISLCVAGRLQPGDIDIFIDTWHEHSSGDTTLSEFLGMTKDEYRRWVKNDSSITDIIEERRVLLVTIEKALISKKSGAMSDLVEG